MRYFSANSGPEVTPRLFHGSHLLSPEFLLFFQAAPFGDLIPLLNRLVEGFLGRHRLLQRPADHFSDPKLVFAPPWDQHSRHCLAETLLDGIQILTRAWEGGAELLRGEVGVAPGVHDGGAFIGFGCLAVLRRHVAHQHEQCHDEDAKANDLMSYYAHNIPPSSRGVSRPAPPPGPLAFHGP